MFQVHDAAQSEPGRQQPASVPPRPVSRPYAGRTQHRQQQARGDSCRDLRTLKVSTKLSPLFLMSHSLSTAVKVCTWLTIQCLFKLLCLLLMNDSNCILLYI